MTAIAKPAIPKRIKKKSKKATKAKTTPESDPTPPPVFRLLDLPLELVDMVYKQMLLAGDAGILCTSRAVHSRASKFLSSNGFYRIGVEEYKSQHLIWELPMDDRAGASIQNIEISIFRPIPTKVSELSTTEGRSIADTTFRHFTGLSLHRDTCRVIVRTDVSERRNIRNRSLFRILRMLKGFARFCIIYTPDCEAGASPPALEERMSVYQVIKQRLEPALGPGVPVGKDRKLEGGLEFFPLEYQKVLRGRKNRGDDPWDSDGDAEY